MANMLIAGIDEAGRGPWAGPVIAAAVILNPRRRIKGLADSKQLSPQQRQMLYHQIVKGCLAFGVGRAEVHEIEELNIHYATLLAMQRAVAELSIQPEKVYVDGLFIPTIPFPAEAVVRGDQTMAPISAASIIAKVTRDWEMIENDHLYPGYGFANHKGYGTPEHRAALKKLGISPIHRKSFESVKAIFTVNLVQEVEI